MAAKRRSQRDHRRRTHGQDFLVDPGVVDRLIRRLDLRPDDLVVDIGAGRGALTIPLANAGARVLAIERDSAWLSELQRRIEQAGVASRVQLLRADLRQVRWPSGRWRVVASPPYGLTTHLLSRLFDDPEHGPWRADLLLQWEVARKRAATPPTTLRSPAWAPWWQFDLDERVHRTAFRPVPASDSSGSPSPGATHRSCSPRWSRDSTASWSPTGSTATVERGRPTGRVRPSVPTILEPRWQTTTAGR